MWAAVAVALLFGVPPLLVAPDVPVAQLEARYADGASRFVMVGDQRVHLRDEGRGPALVLLHGTSSSLHTWDAWAAALRDSFRVVRLDLPGFGLTGPSPTRDYSMPAYARFLAAAMDTLGIDRAVVAGNSLGGEIAWEFAAREPSRVRGLVLLDPAGLPTGRGMPLPFRLATMPAVSASMRWITPRTLVARSMRDVYHDDALVADSVVERIWQLARRPGNREAFIDRVRTPRANDGAGLERIAAPTLVVWGAEDTWIPPTLAAEFARRIPGAQPVLLPGVGHVPQEEAPMVSLEPVRVFLRGIP